MKEIIINIPENKFNIFLEFLRQIPFIKIAVNKKKEVSFKKGHFTILKVKKNNYKFNREELNER